MVLDDVLCVLFVQCFNVEGEFFLGVWVLLGGFVDMVVDVMLEDCVCCKLLEKIGVGSLYLEQLGSWGSGMCDLCGWFVMYVYFVLILVQGVVFVKGVNVGDVVWFVVDDVLCVLELVFDYVEILCIVVECLCSKVEYILLLVFLLVELFLLLQL